MTLIAGARLGPYEIVSLLGAGGMGEVYRATDTRLKRQVAIKILASSLALDRDRLARFQREAEVLASLNHPHIAAIYGLEEADGMTALVMELVEGEDLGQRIARGPIPIDEALPIARQIAEALEAAHEQGIIHRDLKPANIKVRTDGAAKVLDFGLAKAMDPGSGANDAMNSPTFILHATMQGVILGTAAYMAPEQARGRAVDRRADIWAFGVVLYEMLTGTRPFAGDDVSITLASVLKDDVPWHALPENTPPRLRRLLERCLDRDVKQRLRDVGEARVEIAKIEAGAADSASVIAGPAAARRGSWRELVPWTVAGMAMAAALAAWMQRPASSGATAAGVIRLPYASSENVRLAEVAGIIVSPDGQRVVFSARGPDGHRPLWVRGLDGADPQPLPDTDDAIEPFWSPDGRSVAFGAQGKLKRIDLGSARAQILTDAARSNSGSWSPAGVIVFSPDYRTPLSRVSAIGRDRSPVTALNLAKGEDGGHRYPVFLPDGRHFLYSASRVESTAGPAVMVGSVDSTDAKELLPDSGPAVYAQGWLLYVRNGVVVAHRFDADRLELSGEPTPIATPAAGTPWALGAGLRLSVSTSGILVIQNGAALDYRLAWFDRAGRQTGIGGPTRRVLVEELPRISSDGTRVIVQRRDAQNNQDLWLGDLARGTYDRFTTDPGFEQMAVWSADGRRIFCATARAGVGGIYAIPIGGGRDEMLLPGTVYPGDASPDGKWLLYLQRGESTRLDIWALPLTGADRTPHAIIKSDFDDAQPHLSPDSRWIAYTSDVTGVPEVYVRRFTDGAVSEPTRVSTGHGTQPRWSRDGHELLFVSAPRGNLDAEMMAVAVKADGSSVAFSAPAALFKMSMLPSGLSNRDYDLSLDGKRFLIGTATPDPRSTPAMLVLNWPAALKK